MTEPWQHVKISVLVGKDTLWIERFAGFFLRSDFPANDLNSAQQLCPEKLEAGNLGMVAMPR